MLGFAGADSPVSRLVTLIEELKANIENDGKEEQKVYDDFACWCEDTIAKKTQDIDSAKSLIEEVSREIVQQEGSKGTFEAEIVQLNKDIATNVESRKEAAKLREKENETYSKERLEAEQCIGALENAAKVLQGAGVRKDASSTLQKVKTLSIVAGVKDAMHRLEGTGEGLLSKNEIATMEQFVEDPNKALESAPEEGTFLQVSNNPFGDYAPQSTRIQGILKNMYSTFVGQLEAANAKEAESKKNADELRESKEQDFETLSENFNRKTQQAADNKNTLAENKQARVDAQAQLKEDEAFFQNTNSNCKQHSKDWAERSRLRTEELGGIGKAIEILTSPEAKKTFESATSTFIQLTQSSPGGKRALVINKLRDLAREHRSLRLASLAVKVKSEGHFDAVITAIDKMIKTVRDEDADDIKGKDFCEREAVALNGEGVDVNHLKSQEEQRQKRIEEKIARLNGEKDRAVQDKENTEAEAASAQTSREEERQEFQKALTDDTNAVALLDKAIESIKAFYTNNQLKLSFIQVSARDKSFLREDPPATFQEPYKGRSSETGGIAAILAMVKMDLENEISAAKKAEAASAAEYEKGRSIATKAIRAQKKSIANLALNISEQEQLKGHAENALMLLDGQASATGASWESHCVSCGWVYSSTSKPDSQCESTGLGETSSFETRKTKRKNELQGLLDAKAALAGAADDFAF